MAEVTVMMGHGVVPSDKPVLFVDDLGVLRGDGCFETVNVRGGAPFLLKEHLRRLENSAQVMEIDLPTRALLQGLVSTAVEEWNMRSDAEAALRIVVTRGRASGGGPTVFVTVDPVSREWIAPRTSGVAVVTASMGVSSTARENAPWLLGGVKAISYASTMSVIRWAKGQGADDALWVSSDGFALEGPTSSLVWLQEGTLFTTSTSTGVLPGTTSEYVLSRVHELGLERGEAIISVKDLQEVDAAWLTSSVRGVASITSIDGEKIGLRPDITADLGKLAGFSS